MRISSRFMVIAAFLTIVGWAFLQVGQGCSASDSTPAAKTTLLEIGKAGPKAATLEIRADKPKEGKKFQVGEPISVHVKASEKVYLTAVYVSSEGDAYVLFPNNQWKDNLLEPGKEYTIFSEKSAVKLTLGKELKTAKIAFYVSSNRVDLAPLEIEPGKPCIIVDHTSKDGLTTLQNRLESMAKDKAFNRVIMAVVQDSAINLMGLPTRGSSDRPESVAGVAGKSETKPAGGATSE
ncbi:MAG: DUF4384 domain-containing protein [Thermodesulfobacteriota bacterium]